MDTDSSSLVDTEGGGEAMLEDAGNDTDSSGDDDGRKATRAPSELARSLGHYRPALPVQQIRRRLRLHGQGLARGHAGHNKQAHSDVTALLMWVALQVTHGLRTQSSS